MFETKRGRLAYYVRFAVINNGRTQADDCEAVLGEICEVDDAGNLRKWPILPVNLKWSGEDPVKDFTRACFKTIYPGGRKVFYDIGSLMEDGKYFCFELPRHFIEQWEVLAPDKFKIQISVHAKNAEKIARNFEISWSGKWKRTEEEMSKEIIVKML